MRQRDDVIRKALKELEQLLEESPGDVNAHLKAADLCVELDDAPNALRHFEAAARSYEFEGALLQAVAVRKRMLRVDANHVAASEALALLFLDLGMATEASEQFRHIAEQHTQRGHPHEAVTVLKHALERCPADLPLQVALAEAYVTTGQTRIAMSLMAVIGERLRQDARWDLFEDVLHRMQFLGADQDDIARGLAEAALRRGMRAEAASMLKGLIRSDAGHPRTQALLRELLDARASNDDAER